MRTLTLLLSLTLGCGSEFSAADARAPGMAGMSGSSAAAGSGGSSGSAGVSSSDPWIDCSLSPPLIGGLDVELQEWPEDIETAEGLRDTVLTWPIRFEVSAPRRGGFVLGGYARIGETIVQAVTFDSFADGATERLVRSPSAGSGLNAFVPEHVIELSLWWAPAEGGEHEGALPSECHVVIDGAIAAEWLAP